MDPCLVQYWGDIHHTMITYSRALIQKQLPADLVARIGERVFVVEQNEPVHQGYIEILDLKSSRRVVTVVEILGPSNKVPGPGRELYIK
jgi:hypothetical protein